MNHRLYVRVPPATTTVASPAVAVATPPSPRSIAATCAATPPSVPGAPTPTSTPTICPSLPASPRDAAEGARSRGWRGSLGGRTAALLRDAPQARRPQDH